MEEQAAPVSSARLFAFALLALTAMSGWPLVAQGPAGADSPDRALETAAPAVRARMRGVEQAQGVLFNALIAGNGRVREAEVQQRVMRRLSATAGVTGPDAEADKGFDALGARGAQLVRRGFAFHREVLAIYASRSPADRRDALEAAVRRYRSGNGPSLPDAAKDMQILYDHAYTSFVAPAPPDKEPRRELAYPALTGVLWAARWYSLAVLDPLETFDAPAERDRGLGIVAARLDGKLSMGAPPNALPTELPLAPAIAPGLVAMNDRAAAIVDNLHLMLDVLADVLVRAPIARRRTAVDEVIAQFTDREYRCVQTDEWIVVALRHSIFAQGGPALATMNTYERSGFSGLHGQHYGPRRPPPPCDAEPDRR